jgi:hypothetical protein
MNAVTTSWRGGSGSGSSGSASDSARRSSRGHGEFRHFLSLRKVPPPIPTQWVISSGRPERGIEGLWLRPIDGWPSGFYEGPPLLWTRLVVVSELPVTRDTLLLRLLGAGRVLNQAIAELKALQAEAPERTLALPILLRLRLEISAR